ncbi:MAG: transglycosylase SLT domain-containing protein, partial [Alphaproteobacteria bacterium]|nr:transglycosylase SLT domain-containing protein [Alphaproteobacteria bacterium]
LFFAELGKTLDADDLSRLGAALEAQDQTYFEVLLGKTAATRGMVIPSLYFPLHGLAEAELPVSTALALSIARRESEFNEAAGSPVGALGLMQLMPGTASDVARSLDLPYDKNRLTTDWRYNATLGSRYLADLTDRFGDSPVQIAAGYNAGPGRPRDWMQERGDPRSGEVDVIDWIEMIPFRETRNYVQRVTESIPVYEARLTGVAGPIAFTQLLRGEENIVRPVARADGTLELPAPVTGDNSEQDPSPALPRPVARPVDAVTDGAATPTAAELMQTSLTTASVPPQRPIARPEDIADDASATIASGAVTTPAVAVQPAAAAPSDVAPSAVVAANPPTANGPRATLRPVARP